MYVTRPISTFRNFSSILSTQTSEGLYTGYLVVTDEEIESDISHCLEPKWCTRRIDSLPFPQDKILVISHKPQLFDDRRISAFAWFLPVLDQPLSSNRYYIIRLKGKHQGKATTCSREEDMTTCCYTKEIKDLDPEPFDPRNIYQQFEICSTNRKGHFFARSVAVDGFPPYFLSMPGWEVFSYEACQSPPVEAQGLDASLHTYLPKFKFPISIKRSTPVVIGKWCCPFVFVKEEITLKEQMKNHFLYNMTLEQWWEEIYSCENEIGFEDSNFTLNESIQRQLAHVHGMDAVRDDQTNSDDGTIWFWVRNQHGKKGTSVGLSSIIFEKMRKMQEGRGWVDGQESNVRVERVEKIENVWKRFGCYVLVESFVLRRMDGTLVLNCDFKHSHRIQSKWE